MVRKHTHLDGKKALVCDVCGEGIFSSESKSVIKDFRKQHSDCAKPQHAGLEELKNDPEA